LAFIMARFQVHSAAEQVYRHLRGMIVDGRVRGELPGVLRLEAELVAGRRAVMAAIARLEQEGLVVGGGVGRRRRVSEDAAKLARGRSGLRVVILAYDEDDKRQAPILEMVHRLRETGHEATISAATSVGLGMEVERVATLVEQTAADAWLVVAGSRDILEWFSRCGVPVFAIFGRHLRLPIGGAGPRMAPVMEVLANRLVDLGHRRISLLVHRERRVPRPGPPERAFLGTLAARGIVVGSFHLPSWKEDSEGFRHCLESLFQLTPPTALVLAEPFMVLAAMQFLAERGLMVPGDVSMVCLEPDPVFTWSKPEMARIEWDPRRLIRAAVRWVEHVAAGIGDHTKTPIEVVFREGETVGPVKEGRPSGNIV
jgi:DNA-binding LacI/PurR family transcriptional regulator